MLQGKWTGAATLVTGVTALVGWLASPPATVAPGPHVASPRAVAAPSSARRGSGARVGKPPASPPASVQLTRLPSAPAFAQPQRNLFQFPAAPRRARGASDTAFVGASATAVAPTPVPVPFRLSGTASQDDGATWTAVLSGAAGVVLARPGDMVGGPFRVEHVAETTADLVDLRDGHAVRLTLGAAR